MNLVEEEKKKASKATGHARVRLIGSAIVQPNCVTGIFMNEWMNKKKLLKAILGWLKLEKMQGHSN